VRSGGGCSASARSLGALFALGCAQWGVDCHAHSLGHFVPCAVRSRGWITMRIRLGHFVPRAVRSERWLFCVCAFAWALCALRCAQVGLDCHAHSLRALRALRSCTAAPYALKKRRTTGGKQAFPRLSFSFLSRMAVSLRVTVPYPQFVGFNQCMDFLWGGGVPEALFEIGLGEQVG